MKTIQLKTLSSEIIQAFDSDDFSKLCSFIEHDDSDIALLYKAIAAENGLHQSINIERAINIYKMLYKKGNLFAGLALAKVYQKGVTLGDQERAKLIFIEIAKDSDVSLSSYAKYKLISIEAKDILNDEILDGEFIKKQTKEAKARNIDIKLHLLNLKIQKIEEVISLYPANIAQIETIDDDQMQSVEAKIFFQQALLEKKIIGLRESFLLYLEQDFKGGEIERARLSEVNREQIEQKKKIANDLFRKSAIHFLPANIEILNQGVEQELENILKSSYIKEKTIIQLLSKLENALEDSTNINSKLLFARIVSTFPDKVPSETDKSLKLTREVLLSDPFNKRAKAIQSKLLEPMLEQLEKKLASDLKSIIKKNTPPNSGFFLNKISNNRKKAADLLYLELKKYLFEEIKESAFVRGHMDSTNFLQIENLHKQLYTRLSKEMKSILESFESDSKLEMLEEITIKFKEEIASWSKMECSKYSAFDKLSGLMNEKIRKRQKFRDKLVDLLCAHRIRCAALSENKDFRVISEDGKFIKYTEYFASLIAPMMGPIYGLAIGISVIGSREIRSYFSALINESILTSARKFKLIGESEITKGFANERGAEEKYKLIAVEIEKRYGTQLDRVMINDVEFLAEVAFEKMINHLQQDSSVYKLLSSYTQNIALAFIGYFVKIEKEKYSEDKCIATLLEGLTLGNLSTGRITKDGIVERVEKNRTLSTTDKDLGWDAVGFFEKPGVTNDGERIFFRKGTSDVSRYGVRYGVHIPSGYSSFAQVKNKGLKKELDNNLELVVLGSKIDSSKTKQNIEVGFNKQIYYENIKKVRKSLIKSVVTGVAGLVLCLEGGFATAAALGFHASIAVPLLTSISASLFLIPPVAAGLLAIGTALTIRGVAKGITSFAEEQKLNQEKKKMHDLQKQHELTSIERDKFSTQEKDFIQKKSSSIFYTLLKITRDTPSKRLEHVVAHDKDRKFTSRYTRKGKSSSWLERSSLDSGSFKQREN